MNLFLLRPAARRRRSLLVVAGLATAGLTLLPAVTASAHVRVTPDNPTSGAFSALTFRVPNESETAGTVKLTVDLPQDNPFLYVSTKPVPGWTAVATTSKLDTPVESYGTTLTTAVSRVTWTADKGVAIGPGQYQEFSISVGPLPAAGTIELPTTQTYSDGEGRRLGPADPGGRRGAGASGPGAGGRPGRRRRHPSRPVGRGHHRGVGGDGRSGRSCTRGVWVWLLASWHWSSPVSPGGAALVPRRAHEPLRAGSPAALGARFSWRLCCSRCSARRRPRLLTMPWCPPPRETARPSPSHRPRSC